MLRTGPTIALAAALALAAAAARAEDPLRIGFIASLSSSTSQAGPDMLDSFKLGLKELGNKLGGRPVEFTTADDELKPDVGVQKCAR
jgi:branched-chain amino acid transport system substrate-binding protein